MTEDEARKIIAEWIMNDSDKFDLDDFGYTAANDLLSKLRPAEPPPGLTPPNRSGPKKSDGGEPQRGWPEEPFSRRVGGPHS